MEFILKTITSNRVGQDKLVHLFKNASDLRALSFSIVTTLFKSAALVLLYFFITATPETTVYQLSQLIQSVQFISFTVLLALIYAGIKLALNPSSNKHVYLLGGTPGVGTVRYGKTRNWDDASSLDSNQSQQKQ